MRKVIYYCDRCGIQITGHVSQLATVYFDANDCDVINHDDVDYGADLCADCYNTIDDLIAKEIQTCKQLREKAAEVKAKSAEPKTNAKKVIDLGKVGALRKAGWSWEKIAEEFHCAPQTVINHWNKYNDNQEVES